MNDNPTKWPNTFKQFVGKLPTNFLSVLGHFVNLALKGLKLEWQYLSTMSPNVPVSLNFLLVKVRLHVAEIVSPLSILFNPYLEILYWRIIKFDFFQSPSLQVTFTVAYSILVRMFSIFYGLWQTGYSSLIMLLDSFF